MRLAHTQARGLMVDRADMQKVKEKVMSGEGYLHVKNLPKNTVREIIDFLNNKEEFGDDWAVGMKFIWDTFKGVVPPKDSQILSELELLHQRIDALESRLSNASQKEEKPSGKRMADGGLKGN